MAHNDLANESDNRQAQKTRRRQQDDDCDSVGTGVDFEWQASKADTNARKHGVGFEEASTVFANPLARTSTILTTQSTRRA